MRGLGANEVELAGQALPERGHGVDVRWGHRGADHRGSPRRLVRLVDGPGGIIVHHPDTELVVTDSPDAGQQQLLERRSRQPAPAIGPFRWHRRGQLSRVRVGEQVDLATAGDQESRPTARRRGQCGQGGGQCRPAAGQRLHGKSSPGAPHRLGRVEAGKDPVDGADPRRVRGRVNQERQAVVPRAGRVARIRIVPAALHLEVGRVTVVPVGDQRLPRGQVRRHRRVLSGVGHGPEPVPCAVRGLRAQQRWPGRGHLVNQPGRGAAGLPVSAVVQQENRLQVRLGRLHELPPARYRPRHDIFVRQHDPRTGRGEPQRADQASLHHLPGGRAAGQRGTGAVPGSRVLCADVLFVDVQGRLCVRYQDAEALPLPQQPGRLAISPARAARILARQDEPDHIVRIGREQLVRRVVRDHVVRW